MRLLCKWAYVPRQRRRDPSSMSNTRFDANSPFLPALSISKHLVLKGSESVILVGRGLHAFDHPQ